MSVYTIWVPAWWLSGGVKAVTAMASVPTGDPARPSGAARRGAAEPKLPCARANAALADKWWSENGRKRRSARPTTNCTECTTSWRSGWRSRTRELKDVEQQLVRRRKWKRSDDSRRDRARLQQPAHRHQMA
jgi:hypothetical protein